MRGGIRRRARSQKGLECRQVRCMIKAGPQSVSFGTPLPCPRPLLSASSVLLFHHGVGRDDRLAGRQRRRHRRHRHVQQASRPAGVHGHGLPERAAHDRDLHRLRRHAAAQGVRVQGRRVQDRVHYGHGLPRLRGLHEPQPGLQLRGLLPALQARHDPHHRHPRVHLLPKNHLVARRRHPPPHLGRRRHRHRDGHFVQRHGHHLRRHRDGLHLGLAGLLRPPPQGNRVRRTAGAVPYHPRHRRRDAAVLAGVRGARGDQADGLPRRPGGGHRAVVRDGDRGQRDQLCRAEQDQRAELHHPGALQNHLHPHPRRHPVRLQARVEVHRRRGAGAGGRGALLGT